MFAALFVGRDFVVVRKRPADIVQPLQQCLFTERVDLEAEDALVRLGNCLCRQINGERVSSARWA